jgi:hypothetical protein
MSCASSGHIIKLKQSIFAPFDIYGSNLGGGVKLPTFRTKYDAATMSLSCIPHLGNSVLENKELEGKKWKVLCRGKRRDSKSWKTEKETESA